MKLMKWKLLLAAGAAFAFSGQANAQATQDIVVSATVPSFCLFDVATSETTMDFDLSGVATATADFSATTDLAWRCSNGVDFDISISPGGSTDQEARELDSGTATLPYNLFIDGVFSAIWGDGGGTTDVVTVTGLGMGNVGNTTVHGRILLGDAQAAEPDTYTDTVTVTITP